jgi:K+-transporting ATPase ATPase C chain
MSHWMPAIRIKIFLTVLLGLIYPFVMTGLSQALFPRQASGSFIDKNGVLVGSDWIAQKFEKPQYFWPRPSGVDYNPLPSGGSNLGPTSADLKKAVDERRAKLQTAHGANHPVPPELLFASGSGLDPDISPEAALYQAERVANTRHMELNQVQGLIQQFTQARDLGFLGEPRVNVLKLNLALDEKSPLDNPEAKPIEKATDK